MYKAGYHPSSNIKIISFSPEVSYNHTVSHKNSLFLKVNSASKMYKTNLTLLILEQ